MSFPSNKMIIFEIGLLERNLKQTILSVHPTVRTYGQTDENFKRLVSDDIPFQQKKKNFQNRTFRTAYVTDHRFCLSIRTYGRSDGQKKSSVSNSVLTVRFEKLSFCLMEMTSLTYLLCLCLCLSVHSKRIFLVLNLQESRLLQFFQNFLFFI